MGTDVLRYQGLVPHGHSKQTSVFPILSGPFHKVHRNGKLTRHGSPKQ